MQSLKILPQYFDAQLKGLKNFEIRKDDRGLKVGDMIKLNEWNEKDGYTGRYIVAVITYATDYAQEDGYMVYGTRLVKADEENKDEYTITVNSDKLLDIIPSVISRASSSSSKDFGSIY